jgi:hypothetical protein
MVRRYVLLWSLGWLLSLGLVCNTSTVVAQSGSRVRTGARQSAAAQPGESAGQRPLAPSGRATLELEDSTQAGEQAVDPLDPRQSAPLPAGYELSPELDQLLTDWEANTQFTRMQAKFVRYEYSDVFSTEVRAIGELVFESPDRARMNFKAADISKLPRNENGAPINPKRRAGENGPPFEVKPANPECWICDGEQLLQVFIEDKTYHRIEIPPQQRGEKILEGPLPFVFGLTKSAAKDRYLFHLGSMHDPRGAKGGRPQLHVVVLPRRPVDACEWSQVELLLNPETYLPSSIRILDPAGTKESVYILSDFKLNSSWLRDPFRLNLNGFQKLEDRQAEMPTATTPPGHKTTRPAASTVPKSAGEAPAGRNR